MTRLSVCIWMCLHPPHPSSPHPPPPPTPLPPLAVLTKAANCVRGKLLPSIFTFDKELVRGWLRDAKEDCCGPDMGALEAYFGGGWVRGE